MTALKSDCNADKVLSMVNTDLTENKNVVLEAVKVSGLALKDASSNLQDTKEVVLAAVKEDSRAIHSASAGMKESNDVLKCLPTTTVDQMVLDGSVTAEDAGKAAQSNAEEDGGQGASKKPKIY